MSVLPRTQTLLMRGERPGGLALVRLRLRLALLTMAVVPMAISLALVYVVIANQANDARTRASGDSETISAALASQVQRTEGMLQVLGAEPAFAKAAVDPTGIDRARETLRTLASGASAALVPEARLADTEGVVRLRLVDGQVVVPTGGKLWVDPDLLTSTLALPAGGIHRSPAFRAPDGSMRISLAMPLGAVGTVRDVPGLLSIDVSLQELLASVGPRLRELGAFALLVDDASGQVIADSRDLDSDGKPGVWHPGPAGLDTMLKQVVAGNDSVAQTVTEQGWAVGVAEIASGSRGPSWSVLVFHPTSPPSFPMELAGALVTLAVLVVVLTFWLSRKVLGPAEELEGSRSELRRMYEAAREDSLRDGLTGLGNHRAFQEELDRQVDWYRRYRVPVALVLIDLDNLKVTNDSEGHAAGDAMLQEIGQLISETVRYSDRAFRIGGDEFAILMPHTDAAAAQLVARRLLARATTRREGARLVPFSGGVSACPELATTRQQLYAQADAALYWVKRHGRGATDVFDAERDHQADQAATDELAVAVAHVASDRPLRAVFQPIVDMNTGEVLAYEGLIRPTENAPFGDPGSLFAAADAVGRTVELDAACFDVVATAAREIPVSKIISVNLSPRTVEAPDFDAANLLDALQQHGIHPSRLIVELTERENVQDIERLRHNLTELQQAGVRIAADDVGAGNAGLRLLSQFRFDIVKIDLSLVQEGAQRDSSKAVLRSLRDLAGRWGAFVIAEGLETSDQLRMVRELGLNAGQGYLLGRPGTNVDIPRMDLDELEAGVLLLQNANARSGISAA